MWTAIRKIWFDEKPFRVPPLWPNAHGEPLAQAGEARWSKSAPPCCWASRYDLLSNSGARSAGSDQLQRFSRARSVLWPPTASHARATGRKAPRKRVTVARSGGSPRQGEACERKVAGSHNGSKTSPVELGLEVDLALHAVAEPDPDAVSRHVPRFNDLDEFHEPHSNVSCPPVSGVLALVHPR